MGSNKLEKCWHCKKRIPEGMTVTCGGSHCQEREATGKKCIVCKGKGKHPAGVCSICMGRGRLYPETR